VSAARRRPIRDPGGNPGISSGLIGVSGEYFVAAELSRMGYVASLTLRNTKGIDIIAANADASRSVGIQVKTQRGEKPVWMLTEKSEHFVSETLFYVFVCLCGRESPPRFHVVPSQVVANSIRTAHARWLSGGVASGHKRKDTSMRKFRDEQNDFLARWDLLGLG
jgi:hypothetical protein